MLRYRRRSAPPAVPSVEDEAAPVEASSPYGSSLSCAEFASMAAMEALLLGGRQQRRMRRLMVAPQTASSSAPAPPIPLEPSRPLSEPVPLPPNCLVHQGLS